MNDVYEIFGIKVRRVVNKGAFDCRDCALAYECASISKEDIDSICANNDDVLCHFELIEESNDEYNKLAEFAEKLAGQFPEVSFAKLSRIVKRTFEFSKELKQSK